MKWHKRSEQGDVEGQNLKRKEKTNTPEKFKPIVLTVTVNIECSPVPNQININPHI